MTEINRQNDLGEENDEPQAPEYDFGERPGAEEYDFGESEYVPEAVLNITYRKTVDHETALERERQFRELVENSDLPWLKAAVKVTVRVKGESSSGSSQEPQQAPEYDFGERPGADEYDFGLPEVEEYDFGRPSQPQDPHSGGDQQAPPKQ
ncbi:MAG TPA: hypothetical protein VK513_19000 [Terriglobales bacterium]|nr:hypothetical protein [Terriglobales bacterium]